MARIKTNMDEYGRMVDFQDCSAILKINCVFLFVLLRVRFVTNVFGFRFRLCRL